MTMYLSRSFLFFVALVGSFHYTKIDAFHQTPTSAFIVSRSSRLFPNFSKTLISFSAFDDVPAQQQQQSKIVEYNDFLPNPNTELSAQDVVQACMDTLLQDSTQGLEVCFAFSSDRCRSAIGGSLDRFNEYAQNPVFQYLVLCNDYNILRVGPIIEGTQTRGAMQTCLMSAIHTQSNNENESNSSSRQFLWTLQQERRPPKQGCWMVHEVLFVNNAYMQTI
jgi:hypothetical protein